MKTILGLGFFLLIAITGCMSKSAIKQAIMEDPSIVLEPLEKNPERFMEALQKASTEARKVAAVKAEEDAKKQMDEELKNPRKPVTPEDRAYRGPKDAPVLLVEYSDFQCPYCKRGYNTVEDIRKKYGEKVRFMFKHLPLDFHPQAMPAAKYFEAIALQSPAKAYQFHDQVFANQEKLGSEGDKLLEKLAKKVGANVVQLKRDLASEKVMSRIQADMEEAKNFGIQGTPGFVVGGVTVRGAYPTSHFEEIIERQLKSVN